MLFEISIPSVCVPKKYINEFNLLWMEISNEITKILLYIYKAAFYKTIFIAWLQTNYENKIK